MEQVQTMQYGPDPKPMEVNRNSIRNAKRISPRYLTTDQNREFCPY